MSEERKWDRRSMEIYSNSLSFELLEQVGVSEHHAGSLHAGTSPAKI